MNTRKLQNETVSTLGFGCMRFPTNDGKIDIAETEKMIDYAYQNGVNYFDTAYVYHGGESEVVAGQILNKYPRDSFYVADKFPVWMAKNQQDLPRIFDEQLKRLGMDSIDFYLLHSLDRNVLGKCDSLKLHEYFTNEKKKGKIKYLGFSFHDTPDILEQIINKHPWDFCQIQLNYMDWTYQDAQKAYQLLTDKNIPIIVMEPVRGGFLANPSPQATELIANLTPKTTPASLALRWAAQHENVKVVLSGMTTMDQTTENVAIFKGDAGISPAENEAAEKVLSIINEVKTVPCTSCRYCMDCPSGVDIPKIFEIYNHYKVVNDGFRTGSEYNRNFPKDKKASNCTNCGVCIEKCPQHIPIPEKLKEADEILRAL